MGRYAMTLRELIDNGFDIGLKDYPIFNEDYRPILNQAIIDHYYFREIGFQNPNIWKHRLNARMRIIMRGRYNDLYIKKQLEFNPLFNIDITETYDAERAADQSMTARATNEGSTDQHMTGTDDSTGMSDITNTDHATSKDNKRAENLSTSAQFPNETVHLWEMTDDVNIDSAAQSKGTEVLDHTADGNSINHTDVDNASEFDHTNTSSSSDTGTVTTGTDEGEVNHYVKHTEGSSAGLPFSKAMIQFKEYVEQFSLDEQVIAELDNLFLKVW